MAHIIKAYPLIEIRLSDRPGPLDLDGIFGRKAPVHLEIGSGKGTFLVAEATARPEIDFLGIEWARKYYLYAVDRVGRWGLPNVRLLRTDAAVFIRDYLRDASVDCVHIYFPDPWPKTRHHKRRFVCAANVEQLGRILKDGGMVRAATDHAEYFNQIESVFAQAKGWHKQSFQPTAGAKAGEWVGTNFERKYMKEERSVLTFAVQRAR